MSLKLKSASSGRFDTIEVAPTAGMYGKQHSVRLPSFSEHGRKSLDIGFRGTSKEDMTTPTSVSEERGYTFDNPGNSTPKHSSDRHSNRSDRHSNRSDHEHGDGHAEDDEAHHSAKKATKFGTFDGVLGRCLLAMWGVIMFLRTGWIVGNAGIWQASLVVILSSSITMLTTLSLCAICTNGEIQHGGPYFLISRSLGPQFGGVIGILFAVGNCIGVSLHLVGFAEAITTLYSGGIFEPGDKDQPWDKQFIAELGLIVLLIISLRGIGWIIRFNLVLLAMMIISVIAFMIGTFSSSPSKLGNLGFTGYSSKTFAENWNADYQDPQQGFLFMIAIFFPSVTGCMAGANISGDLKNPAKNIPNGTISAVFISTVVYIIIVWMLGACVLRENSEGENGLYHEYIIMSLISVWRPLVDMGIYASTFSSATSAFVAAPRIFKAVCDDGLFPILTFFSVGRKSDGEPVRCYILVFVICLIVMLSGDINFIAPFVTNFFLITYALVNYSVFAWSISRSPGWRPSWKYYHGYMSLAAACSCFILMFLIDWIVAFITASVGAALYKYIDYKNPDVHWGTTAESAMYLKACKIALKYQTVKPHAKVARPTFLIINKAQSSHKRSSSFGAKKAPAAMSSNVGLAFSAADIGLDVENKDSIQLFQLADILNYAQGLIIIGNVIVGSMDNTLDCNEFLLRRKSFKHYKLPAHILEKCVMECCISETMEQGVQNFLQLSGLGGIRPNVVLIKKKITEKVEQLMAQSNRADNTTIEEEQQSASDKAATAAATADPANQLFARTYKKLSIETLNNKDKTETTTKDNNEDENKDEKDENDTTVDTNASTSKSKSKNSKRAIIEMDDQKWSTLVKNANTPDRSAVPLWFQTLTDAFKTGCGAIMIPSNDFDMNDVIESVRIHDLKLKHNRTDIGNESRNHDNNSRTETENETENGSDAGADPASNQARVYPDVDIAPHSYIDIWWLYDDGGLTVLIAYLLTKNKHFKTCKIRVMAMEDLGFEDQQEMVSLMTKLRIEAEIVSVPRIIGFNTAQKTTSVRSDINKSSNDGQEEDQDQDQEDEEDGYLSKQMSFIKRRKVSKFAENKIRKYNTVGVTIEEFSKEAQLCLVTMPFPRKKYSWYEYSKIIEDLTPASVPTLFIRGNQEQVLTFVL